MTSPIWQHFDLIEKSKNVKCKICERVLERKDASTKTMWTHLEHVHKTEYGKLKNNPTTSKDKNTVINRIFIFLNVII